MGSDDRTHWTMILRAAEGAEDAREAFARRYLPAVTAYFRARWRGGPLVGEADDAVQEVFLDCFREGGALERADPEAGTFRAFLYGVARNVALRHEERRGHRRERQAEDSGVMEAVRDEEPTLSRIFDRAWAMSMVEEARARHLEAARSGGERAEQRFELLRLRFQEGLPIRGIAQRWGVDPARLHHDYADAREEFRRHLYDAVAASMRNPTREAVEQECARLLEHLAVG